MPANIVVYGKGRVGSAVEWLAKSLQIPVRIVDDADGDFMIAPDDILIPSPGVPPANRAFTKPEQMLSELDFAAAFLPKGAKLIGITGTDGKSTTTWMVYETLRKEYGDDRVFISGNFEIPLSETVRQIRERGVKNPVIVVEISSFMAHLVGRPQTPALLTKIGGKNTEWICFNTSIFTNLETDHLNWHSDMQDYLNAKLRVMRASKVSIVNEQVLEKSKALGVTADFGNSEVRVFGLREPSSNNPLRDSTDGENIMISGRKKYKLSETHFTGPHNAMNLLATGLVGNTLKICSKRTKVYFSEIEGLSHRFESIGIIGGIEYIDDSKATSAQALGAALNAFTEPKVVLIAGGSDKGDSFEQLSGLFAQSVKYAVLIGATREKVALAAKKANVAFEFAETMDEAVQKAMRQGQKGDTILLSPGCASFGLFKDYLDRANQFRSAVEKYTR